MLKIDKIYPAKKQNERKGIAALNFITDDEANNPPHKIRRTKPWRLPIKVNADKFRTRVSNLNFSFFMAERLLGNVEQSKTAVIEIKTDLKFSFIPPCAEGFVQAPNIELFNERI